MGIYDGKDPREVGLYSLSEAAHYLDLAPSTLRSWVRGRDSPTEVGRKRFLPLILPADSDPLRLSFTNLVEAHVLKAIRKRHRIPLRKVREMMDYFTESLESTRPLAEDLQTDSIDLFVERFGQLINLTRHGQLAMREILGAFLKRIKRDEDGRPVELYPFSRSDYQADPEWVQINPRVSFGKPVIKGSGVPTNIVVQRYKAGDSVRTLAEDYGLKRLQVEEAIRYELAA